MDTKIFSNSNVKEIFVLSKMTSFEKSTLIPNITSKLQFSSSRIPDDDPRKHWTENRSKIFFLVFVLFTRSALCKLLVSSYTGGNVNDDRQ